MRNDMDPLECFIRMRKGPSTENAVKVVSLHMNETPGDSKQHEKPSTIKQALQNKGKY